MSDADHHAELAKLRRERDLYLRLLNLGRQSELQIFLAEALGLIVEVADARQGYLELHDQENGDHPQWWIAHGLSSDEIDTVRAAISRGIIAEALATGKTIVTPSALLDPRFSERDSVRLGRIEAVLCTPIGDDPPRGVLYLQGRATPGLFSDEDRARAEIFAQHLAPLVDWLLAQHRSQTTADPTQPLRAALRLDGVIGRSLALAATLKQIALVAPLDVSVLLTGESGTGKSQLARVIHDNGPRAAQPFVEVNCAALPDTLIESELFGAMPGAHSTATRRIEGKVAAAERGTLFLDEIGDLSLSAQGKLLQLLQSRQYYPLGAAQPLQADVRVIAATNQDLRLAVSERRFREDLFYRLQVLPVRVPTLAERRDDIPELAAYFCATACQRHGLPRLELSRNAIRAAQSAEWPGHVRQLAHAMEAAVIRAAGAGAAQVERAHVFPEAAAEPTTSAPLTFQETTRRFHERLLRETLEDTGWNVVETARRLDLARSHVYNLIRAFGLQR
ncbi:MAG: sigma 54-interacting transcriptional regulator [Deltaproteobacteria bacterium]|nr:sigma 54-interacting transcriptional regulator [Deltaproteobacteria bacterium]MBI3390940.1 sigma 54-interacting transcriptional regulator [Deltaproteobacteria bacterium]